MDAFKFNEMAGLPGFFKPNGHKKKRRPYRRQMKGGIRVAVLRAFNAARSYKEGRFPAVAKAAQACGTTAVYVRAALTILAAENTAIEHQVLKGHVPLLAAAKQLHKLAALVKAYREISTSELPMFSRTVGVADLFDRAIAPAL